MTALYGHLSNAQHEVFARTHELMAAAVRPAK